MPGSPTARKKVLLALLFAIGVLALPASARAAQMDSYADAAATDDTPPCVQADPCQSIATALTDTLAGGTVHVAPGTYNEALTVGDGKSLVYDGSGGPFGAIVNGGASTAVTIGAGASAGTIQGFTLRADNTAVQLNGSGTVSGNLFDSTGLNSFGLTASQPGTKTISGNQFTGDGVVARTGIQISDTSPTISQNSFSDLKFGIRLFGGAAQIDGNEIGSGAPDSIGIEVRAGSTAATPVITTNRIEGQSTAVRAAQLLAPAAVGATVARNRLIGNDVGLSLDDSAGPVTMQSDLLAANGTHILATDVMADGGGDLTATNITVWGGSFGAQLFDTSFVLDSSIFGAAGITAHPGSASCTITNSRGPVIGSSPSACDAFQTTAPPQFVDEANLDPALNDYHLAPGSQMIDQGNPTPPPGGTLDLDGDQRAIAGTCGGTVRRDIGADEFSPSCATPAATVPAADPRCAALRKKLKKAKKALKAARSAGEPTAKKQRKVRRLRKKLKRLGC